MNSKDIYLIPNSDIDNMYYFFTLGKSIAFAAEFESECIELSKIHTNYNSLKETKNDGYLLEYSKTSNVINKKSKKYIPLNDYITKLKCNDILDDDSITLLSNAREIRNKIAHQYSQEFYKHYNNFDILDSLIETMKDDIQQIIDAKILVDLIFMLTVDSESHLTINSDGQTNTDEYRNKIMEWIFSRKIHT